MSDKFFYRATCENEVVFEGFGKSEDVRKAVYETHKEYAENHCLLLTVSREPFPHMPEKEVRKCH